MERKNLDEYHYIYPFTTENVAGYINEFDLENKRLLTVGSSSDQVINASLKNTKDVTLIDINPYTKYYFYLKVASLLSLNKDEFLNFLCYKDYYGIDKHNTNSLNNETFKKVYPTLKSLSKDAASFWKDTLTYYNYKNIRKDLFKMDEENIETLQKINPYLSSNISYDETKERVKKLNVEFIYGDIFKHIPKSSYDNIWLSNILESYNSKEIKYIVDSYNNILNSDGKLLISYLYSEILDEDYIKLMSPIHRINYIKELLEDYKIDLINFNSVYDISRNIKNNYKDKALILTK